MIFIKDVGNSSILLYTTRISKENSGILLYEITRFLNNLGVFAMINEKRKSYIFRGEELLYYVSSLV